MQEPGAAAPSRSPRATAQRLSAVAAAALLTGAVVGDGVAWREPWRSVPDPIATLAQAAAGQRPVQARLSGGFAWAPLAPVRGMGTLSSAAHWEVAAAAARIREHAEGLPAVETHALGVAHLLLGDVEGAVAQLETAADLRPEDPAVLSDLAAALIERGRAPEHARDLVRALDVGERARTLAPTFQEAAFNRALALERMQLREAAIAAWDLYLELDQGSAWAGEVSQRLNGLRGPSPRPTWSDERTAFRLACAAEDLTTATSLLRRHPQEATETVTAELLPGWAKAVETGDIAATAALASLATGATAVAEVVGDRLLLDAVAEIRALAARPREQASLAGAILTLARGQQALDALRPTEAGPSLARAEEELAARRSPLSPLAALSRLSAEYYAGSFEDGAAADLQAAADLAERRTVAAKVRWLRGLVFRVRGDLPRALSLLQEAADRLEGLGFAGDATFVRAMEAGTFRALGRNAEAWRRDLAVFSRLDGIPDPRRTQALLAEAARVTEMEGLGSAALALQQASLQYAERHDTAYDRCDGQVWLARMAARAGRVALAARAVEAAERLRMAVEDPAARDRLGAELNLGRVHLALTSDPGAAARAAGEAVDFYRGRREPPRVIESLLLRARAYEALGNVSAAEGDYLDGLEAMEAQREVISDPYLRISFFEGGAELARALVRLQWARGQSDRALLLANRVRARTLRESMAAAPALEDLQQLQRNLAPTDGVLFYAGLPDRTLVWAITRDRVDSSEIACGERELERRIEEWRKATLLRDLARSTAAAEDLHRLLLTPVLPALEQARTLRVVPDGPLHRLSWTALRDSRTGRAWVEEIRVAVVPYLSAVPARRRASQPTLAAVVGNPRFDPSLYPGLPDLPGALEEARSVARLYPRPTLLLEGDATQRRVLEAAERAHVLHFAGHGLADVVDAERSSLPLADGALLARDIRQRDLRRLQLVVLAACRSGDGPLFRAEGPLSLARPFLEAGAQAVLVTLFDLPDRQATTAEVHRHLLDGVGAAEAVRRTIAECWNAPHPDALTCGGLQLVVHGIGD